MSDVDLQEELLALLRNPDAPAVFPAWRCPYCRSHRVMVSYRTWYLEQRAKDTFHLNRVGIDSQESDPNGWFCDSCKQGDFGSPDPA